MSRRTVRKPGISEERRLKERSIKTPDYYKTLQTEPSSKRADEEEDTRSEGVDRLKNHFDNRI